MSNRISLVRGTTKQLSIDLVDQRGQALGLDRLVGATAEFLLRNQPSDSSNVLAFTTKNNPVNLAFQATCATVDLAFYPSDTVLLALQFYFYQLQVTLADGEVLDVIPWDLLDLNAGGSAAPAPPVFDNTVKITQDYPLPNDMTYMTPGGSPIPDAQVRVYYKSDYDAGKLDNPIGITMTDAGGKWVQPILVAPGFTYTVVLFKQNEFGPDAKSFFA